MKLVEQINAEICFSEQLLFFIKVNNQLQPETNQNNRHKNIEPQNQYEKYI